jgi:hypothetical protein
LDGSLSKSRVIGFVNSHDHAYLASVLFTRYTFIFVLPTHFYTCKPFKSTTISLDGRVRDAASSDPLSADPSSPGVCSDATTGLNVSSTSLASHDHELLHLLASLAVSSTAIIDAYAAVERRRALRDRDASLSDRTDHAHEPINDDVHVVVVAPLYGQWDEQSCYIGFDFYTQYNRSNNDHIPRKSFDDTKHDRHLMSSLVDT